MAGRKSDRHAAGPVRLRPLVGERVTFDHVINRFGNIGRVIAHPFYIFGAEQKMDTKGDRAGILHHVGEQFPEQRGVHRIDFFVAIADLDCFLAVLFGEAVQRITQQVQRKIGHVVDAPERLARHVFTAQRIDSLAELCRSREMLLFEDCALSLLSAFADGRAQGSAGHWSVFCLYKTLPLPNGALLVQNDQPVESLERLKLRQAGSASVAGRMAELFVQRLRGRINGVGAALAAVKRGMGAAAGAFDVRRANVGDIGFNLDEVDLAMSPISERLIARFDYDDIRSRRIANYQQLASELTGGALLARSAITPLFPVLPDGVCPLFFPVLVPDKAKAADALRKRGVDVIEFWNDPVGDGGEMGANARFFRAHVLELPIHQDLGRRHISHIARQVSSLATRMAA